MEKKRAALIVGATCSFGHSLVEKLAPENEYLVLTGHPDEGEKLSILTENEKCRFEYTGFYGCRVDVTDSRSIEQMMWDLERRQLLITGMVYCAGVNALAPASMVTENIWDRILNVNLKGFFFTSRAVAGHMAAEGIKGSIVAVASQHSKAVNYDRAPYCASKAGLVHLIREMALEYAVSGIRFNAVSPSFIQTESNEELLKSPGSRRKYLSRIPLGRYASGDDVSGAVRFLLSKEASFITGLNMMVDGGYTIL